MENFSKILKIIINFIINGSIIFMLLILLFMCYTRFILKDTSSLANGYSFFKVISGSMEPELKIGDYILVKESDDYKVGDIITYKEGKTYITHRIKEINKNKIIAAGDANNTDDDVITKNQIKGKYIKKINKFGKIYEFLTNKQTITIILISLLIVRIFISVISKR